ncbi:MAG: 2Fe-2S iron-sulfur cluster-binding protein [Steroidobacteraceae bacterium]
MVKIVFIDAGGAQIALAAQPGATLMEVARDGAIEGIVAECGGSCACATCHVYVDASWCEKLKEPAQMEKDMLEFVIEPRPNSRLACQITIGRELDGIAIHVPPRQI